MSKRDNTNEKKHVDYTHEEALQMDGITQHAIKRLIIPLTLTKYFVEEEK